MQSKDLKSQVNKSIKKLSEIINQKKKVDIIKIISYIVIPVLLILIVIFAINIKNIFFNLRVKSDMNNTEENILFEKAEEAYNNGYLENSSIYYQNLINLNIKQSEKILAYKKLFEIEIRRNNFETALEYLGKIERIDRKNKLLEIPLDRIKIFLRLNQYEAAREEINKNQNRLKKSNEFLDLKSIYFLKTGRVSDALKELEKIPYNKRDFNIHSKIIHCYTLLGKPDKSVEYINRIEKKFNLLGINEISGELIILKEINKMMLGSLSGTSEELERAGSLTDKYRDIALKLRLYSSMLSDDEEGVTDTIKKSEDRFSGNIQIIKLIGNYYTYKKNYHEALYFYEKLKNIPDKNLQQDELMVFSNLYFFTKDYNNSIESMEELFTKFDYKDPLIFKNLAYIYGILNDFERQIFYLKEGINQYPKDIDFYIRISLAYLNNNNPDTAIRYVNEARNILKKNRSMVYDKRLDALYVYARQKSGEKIDENELLSLREKETKNPDYYFKIIQYYIEDRKYSDARRELETAAMLPLDDKQKRNLDTFKVILSLSMNDAKSFDAAKDDFIRLKSDDIYYLINLSIVYIIDDDYNKALDTLDSLAFRNLKDDLKDRIFYLQAICYFYKNNYPLAAKVLSRMSDKGKGQAKYGYLKRLIINRHGETQ